MWHARTPSAVHYANRLFAHQSHYADRPTTTPSSPSEQKNRAAERCYIAARARKRAGTKMHSPARRQNVG